MPVSMELLAHVKMDFMKFREIHVNAAQIEKCGMVQSALGTLPAQLGMFIIVLTTDVTPRLSLVDKTLYGMVLFVFAMLDST